MPKFLVWDNLDADVLAIFQGLTSNWRDATDAKNAAWLYADAWYNADRLDDQVPEYFVYALPEEDARRIFADTAEDYLLDEIRKQARCFEVITTIDVEEVDDEEESDD